MSTYKLFSLLITQLDVFVFADAEVFAEVYADFGDDADDEVFADADADVGDDGDVFDNVDGDGDDDGLEID